MGLDDFELGAKLGQGAFGEVLRAVHRPSGTAVAIKTVAPSRPEIALGLERELAALARLDHPGILHLYDHGVAEPGDPFADGAHWLALELASGGSLEGFEPTDWPQTRKRLVEVLEALSYAHARGVVHRDLKPANLVRCAAEDIRPGVKIADFGLAWALQEDSEGLTRAGSPLYMPPEQIRGVVDDLGPWSDLYALACVAWQWTTGAPPFGWLELRPAMNAQLNGRLAGLRPRYEVPDGLERLLKALLQKAHRKRPPTAAHVLHALGELDDGFTPRGGPLPVPETWRVEQTTPSTAVLSGAGLGLFALRDPPVVARHGERRRMWEVLREAAASGRPAVIALRGPPGSGRRRLGRWLRESAAEQGCAQIAVPAGGDPGTWLRSLQQRARSGATLVDLCGAADRPEVVDLCGAVLLEADTSGPVVLLAAATDAMRDALGPLAGFVELTLEPVTDSALGNFVHQHLGVARGAAEQVAAAAEGLPGVAIDQVRAWVAGDRLRSTPAGFQLRPGADPSPPGPDRLRRAQIDAALAALSQDGRLALCLGALLGAEVRLAEWLPLLERFGLSRRHSPLRAVVGANLGGPSPRGWRIPDPAVRHALVETLREHGPLQTYQAAAAAVLEALEPNPDRLERLGRLRLAAGEVDAAWAAMTRAMDGFRGQLEWTRIRAMIALLEASADGRPQRERFVLAYYRTLSAVNLESASVAVPQTRQLVAMVPELEPDQRDRALRLAAEAFMLADLPEASQAALDGTAATNPRMQRVQARLHLDRGELELAIEGYQALLDHDATRSQAANGLATAHALRGDIDQAAHWFEWMLQDISPRHAHVPLCNLALLWLLEGEPERGAGWARKAIEASQVCAAHQQGYVAVIATVVGTAARDGALRDRGRHRALFHALRHPVGDVPDMLHAIETARSTADPDDHELLDHLAQRIAAFVPA